MATTLYMRAGGVLSTTAGSSTTTTSSQTVYTAASEVLFGTWASDAVKTSFTLSGTISVSLQAMEDNMSANAGGRVKIYRFSAAGVKTLIASGDDGIEFGTANTQMDWTVTPTSTVFGIGDCLIVEMYAAPIGTFGAAYTATMYFDGAAASAYDSLVTITENIVYASPAGRGYFAGGYNAAGSSDIDGINYSTYAAINPASSLPSGRRYPSGTHSASTGYIGGGVLDDGTTTTNIISSFGFTSETAANISATLAVQRNKAQALSSQNVGYWIGGLTSTSTTSNTTDVDAITFATEAAYNPSAALPLAKASGSTSTMEKVRGYLWNAYQSGTTYAGTVNRFAFDTETFTQTGTAVGNVSGNGLESLIAGYSIFNTTGSVCYFATDTSAPTLATLAASVGTAGIGVSGPTDGFIGGNSSATTVISGFRFATGNSRTMSATLGAAKERAAGLTTSRSLDLPPSSTMTGVGTLSGSLIKVINTHYNRGYFLGGKILTNNTPEYLNVTKVDYSTDLVSINGSSLTTVTAGITGVQSREKGYALGGNDWTPQTTCQTITFSTETTSVMGVLLSAAHEPQAGFSTESKGVTFSATQGNGTSISFSSETIGVLTPVTFHTTDSLRGTFQSGSAGYARLNFYTYKFDFDTLAATILSTIPGVGASYTVTGFSAGWYGLLVANNLDQGGGVATFDMATDAYAEVAESKGVNLGQASARTSALSAGGKGYSFGGTKVASTETWVNKYEFAVKAVTTGGVSLSPREAGISVSNYFPLGSTAWMRGAGRATTVAGSQSTLGSGLVVDESRAYRFSPGTETEVEMLVLPGALQQIASTSLCGNTSGYFFTGGSPVSTVIWKSGYYILATNQLSATLTLGRTSAAGVGSGEVGFIVGGYSGTGPVTSAEKFLFSAETMGASSLTLSPARYLSGTASLASRGYLFGGYTTTYIASIAKIDFATEASSALSATLSSVASGAPVVNNEHTTVIFSGQFGTGYTHARASVDLFDNVTETRVSAADSLYRNVQGACLSTGANGYVAGGETGIDYSDNNITRISYSGVITLLAATLTSYSNYAAGAASRSNNPPPGVGFGSLGKMLIAAPAVYTGVAFTVGGLTTAGQYGTVDRIKFSTGVRTDAGSVLSNRVIGRAGTSSNSDGLIPVLTSGLGWSANEYQGLKFFTETSFKANAGITLVDYAPYNASTTSGAKGYYESGSFFNSVNYSTYAVTANAVVQSTTVFGMVASKAATYWKAGVSSVFYLYRLLHATEAVANLGNPSFPNQTKHTFAELQSAGAGYFAGGWISTAVSEINKIAFSTETVSSTTGVLSTARQAAAGVSSLTDGYVCGGHTGADYTSGVSTVEILSFSTETVSAASFALTAAVSDQTALWTPGGTHGFANAGGAGSLLVSGDITSGVRAECAGVGTLSVTAQLGNAPIEAVVVGVGTLGAAAHCDWAASTVLAGAGQLLSVVTRTINALGEGYALGGSGLGIQGYVFQTEVSYPVGGSLRIYSGGAAVSNTQKSYVNAETTLDQFSFDTLSVYPATAVTNYPRSGAYGLSTPTTGYFLGGYYYSGEPQSSYTDRVAFANGAMSQVSTANVLAIYGAYGAAIDGTENGVTVNSNQTTRLYSAFNYASETAHEALLGGHPTSHDTAGVRHGDIGYVFSGYNLGYISAVESAEIVCVQIPTETLRYTGVSMSVIRGGGSPLASHSNGYLLGGKPDNFGSPAMSTVEKFNFWTETASIPSATLGTAVAKVPGVSRKGSKDTGEAFAKTEGTVVARSSIANTLGRGYMGNGACMDGFLHGSQTTYPAMFSYGGFYELATCAAHSDTNGYFFSGKHSTEIGGIIYQTETANEVAAVFTTNRGDRCATSSSTAAYIAGGRGELPWAYDTAAYKFLFTTEALSVMGDSLTLGKSASANVRSSSIGFFVGGEYDADADSYEDPTSDIQSVTFSNDSINTESSSLASARNGAGGTSSASYGYITAGRTLAGGGLSSVERLQFSNKAVTTLAETMPHSGTNRMACTMSANVGYYGGGSRYNWSVVDSIVSLAFGTEAIGQLSATISSLSTTSWYPACCGITAAYVVAQTHFAEVTASGSGTITAQANKSIAARTLAASSGTITASASLSLLQKGAALASGHGSVAAAGVVGYLHNASASAIGTGLVVVAGKLTRNGVVFSGGGGTLSADPHTVFGAASVLSAGGALSASTRLTLNAGSILVGSGGARAEAVAVLVGAANPAAYGNILAKARWHPEFLQWHSASVRPQTDAETSRPLWVESYALARQDATRLRPVVAEQAVSAARNESRAWANAGEYLVAPELLVASARPAALGVVVKDADIITELGG